MTSGLVCSSIFLLYLLYMTAATTRNISPLISRKAAIIVLNPEAIKTIPNTISSKPNIMSPKIGHK